MTEPSNSASPNPPRKKGMWLARLGWVALGAIIMGVGWWYLPNPHELRKEGSVLAGHLRCPTLKQGLPYFEEVWVIAPRKTDGALCLVKQSLAPANHFVDPDSTRVTVFEDGITERQVEDLPGDLIVGSGDGEWTVFWQKAGSPLQRYRVVDDPEQEKNLALLP